MFDYILWFGKRNVQIYMFLFLLSLFLFYRAKLSFWNILNHLPLHLWPQALHCFIGVGALISPLVVDPFLDENNCTLSAGWSANSSPPFDPDSVLFGSNTSDITAAPDTYQYLDSTTDKLLITRLSYAFWIMALINVSKWIRQS